MLRRINKKLNSGRGVTIVIGLVAFLIASLASVAIVTISLNNIQRVDDQQEAQRRYLTVTSAATLLREKLAGKEIVITDKLDSFSKMVTERVVKGKNNAEPDPLAKEFAEAMLGGTLNSVDTTLTLTIKDAGGADLTDTDGDSMDVKVKVRYTGSRVEMRIEPPDGSDAAADFPVKLIFGGTKADIGEPQPVLKYNPDEEEWYVAYYLRTTRVVFDESHIYAQAE